MDYSENKRQCFCEEVDVQGGFIKCSNDTCPVVYFHRKCIKVFRNVNTVWYCLLCRQNKMPTMKLPQRDINENYAKLTEIIIKYGIDYGRKALRKNCWEKPILENLNTDIDSQEEDVDEQETRGKQNKEVESEEITLRDLYNYIKSSVATKENLEQKVNEIKHEVYERIEGQNKKLDSMCKHITNIEKLSGIVNSFEERMKITEEKIEKKS